MPDIVGIFLLFLLVALIFRFFCFLGVVKLNDDFYDFPLDYIFWFLALLSLVVFFVTYFPFGLFFIPIYFMFGYICMIKYYVHLKEIEYKNNDYYFYWVDRSKTGIFLFCEFYWPIILLVYISKKITFSFNIPTFIKTPSKEWEKVKSKLEENKK